MSSNITASISNSVFTNVNSNSDVGCLASANSPSSPTDYSEENTCNT